MVWTCRTTEDGKNNNAGEQTKNACKRMGERWLSLHHPLPPYLNFSQTEESEDYKPLIVRYAYKKKLQLKAIELCVKYYGDFTQTVPNMEKKN